jgi:hypothetical protein
MSQEVLHVHGGSCRSTGSRGRCRINQEIGDKSYQLKFSYSASFYPNDSIALFTAVYIAIRPTCEFSVHTVSTFVNDCDEYNLQIGEQLERLAT